MLITFITNLSSFQVPYSHKSLELNFLKPIFLNRYDVTSVYLGTRTGLTRFYHFGKPVPHNESSFQLNYACFFDFELLIFKCSFRMKEFMEVIEIIFLIISFFIKQIEYLLTQQFLFVGQRRPS